MGWNLADRMIENAPKHESDEARSGVHIPIASRRSGFERVRSGVLGNSGAAILLTGEGGAGKTWLWSEVSRSLPLSWRSISVDLTSGLSPAELLLLIGHPLGCRAASGLALARLEIASALRDEAADGRSWMLVVEDAHCSSDEAWEEIRVIANHLGRDGGFSALLIIAQTELIRRLAARNLASVAGRITDHVHLPPLDLDECRALIAGSASQESARSHLSFLEGIHRDARGNCREMLRLSRSSERRAVRKFESQAPHLVEAALLTQPAEMIKTEHVIPPIPDGGVSGSGAASEPEFSRPPMLAESAPPTEHAGLSLVPSRPPLRLEDGLIEVGWQGDDASRSIHADDSDSEPNRPFSGKHGDTTERADSMSADPALSIIHEAGELVAKSKPAEESTEEWVEDSYAALQAWSEWSRNNDRATELQRPLDTDGPDHQIADGSTTLDEDAPSPTVTGSGVTIRAEAQHDYSPYGQLFSQIRKSKQS